MLFLIVCFTKSICTLSFTLVVKLKMSFNFVGRCCVYTIHVLLNNPHFNWMYIYVSFFYIIILWLTHRVRIFICTLTAHCEWLIQVTIIFSLQCHSLSMNQEKKNPQLHNHCQILQGLIIIIIQLMLNVGVKVYMYNIASFFSSR